MKLPPPPTVPAWIMRWFPLNGAPPKMPRKWGNWVDAVFALMSLAAVTVASLAWRDAPPVALLALLAGLIAVSVLLVRAVLDVVRQEQVRRWLDEEPGDGDVPQWERFA